MSSQYLQAWVVDKAVFSGVLGSGDRAIVKRACSCSIADEVREDVEAGGKRTLEGVVEALVDGSDLKAPSWTTRRCMSLVADAWGTRVDRGLTLPGRGWHDLGPAWKHWGAGAIATLWTTEPAWTKQKVFVGGWPHVMWGPAATMASVVEEATAFVPHVVSARGVPSEVPRFGEGQWPLDLLGDQVAVLAAELAQIAKAARRAKKSLVIWLDGSE
jgi:hypothetical protein